jgi:hypothetical protein
VSLERSLEPRMGADIDLEAQVEVDNFDSNRRGGG